MESFLILLQNKNIDLKNIINKEIEFNDCVSVYKELKDRPE
jgi:hypothetical protein